MVPPITNFYTENIDRNTAVYSNTAGNIGDADGYNRYIPMLYAKKVLFDFYKSTVFREITNTD
jgi:hypothetical protein